LLRYIGAEQGTPLRGEVKNVSVTSHQLCKHQKFKEEVCAFFSFGGAFQTGGRAETIFNKRSDFPLLIRSWSVHGPFTGVGGFWKYFGGMGSQASNRGPTVGEMGFVVDFRCTFGWIWWIFGGILSESSVDGPRSNAIRSCYSEPTPLADT
jgi:hypothetical protein